MKARTKYLIYFCVPLPQADIHLGCICHLRESHLKVPFVVAEDFAHRDADEHARGVAGNPQAIRRNLRTGDALRVDDDGRDRLRLGFLRAQPTHCREASDTRRRGTSGTHTEAIRQCRQKQRELLLLLLLPEQATHSRAFRSTVLHPRCTGGVQRGRAASTSHARPASASQCSYRRRVTRGLGWIRLG